VEIHHRKRELRGKKVVVQGEGEEDEVGYGEYVSSV